VKDEDVIRYRRAREHVFEHIVAAAAAASEHQPLS
jgi:hypothetical protein